MFIFSNHKLIDDIPKIDTTDLNNDVTCKSNTTRQQNDENSDPRLKNVGEKMIKKAGGQEKWVALSESKKAEKKAVMLEEAIAELGHEAFNKLSDDDQRVFWLFIWAGCGCHKDLNTVQDGYQAMQRWWNEHEDAVKPVLLANHENDLVIQERPVAIQQGNTPTLAQERAFL